jgi:hypothetical protein
MKSSLHSLILFLPLFCNCQLRKLDSIQFLCSKAHIAAGWRLETRLTLLNWTLLYNHFARATQKTQPLSCSEGVSIAPLHTKGSYSSVACVFDAAGMCLQGRCLAMNVYPDFTIPAFGHNVTISRMSTVCLKQLWSYVIHWAGSLTEEEPWVWDPVGSLWFPSCVESIM